MADISEWSPVDESNNQPPPNGWPEGMAPSAVNNSARAIMGAVRRHHDQIVSGSLELPYLKLTGGEVSGQLTVSGILTGQNSIEVTGTNAAFVFSDRDGVSADWMWYANAGAAHLWHGGNVVTVTPSGLSTGGTVTAAALTSTGAMSVAGNSTVGGQITGGRILSNDWITAVGTITGAAIVGGTVHANNTLSAGTSVAAPTIAASGALSGASISSSGNIAAAGTVSAQQLTSSGNVNATGTVAAAYIHSTGNIDAVGTVGAATLVSSGNVNAVNLGTSGYLSVGTDLTVNAYSTLNAVQPNAEHDGFVGKAGRSYDSMSCWNYITVSDRRHKSDIEVPTGCLDVVKAVPPHTYKWADGKDPGTRHWGLIAQEVGEAAGRDFSGRLIDPETGQERLVLNEVFALLWGAVRELTAEVEALREVANAR